MWAHRVGDEPLKYNIVVNATRETNIDFNVVLWPSGTHGMTKLHNGVLFELYTTDSSYTKVSESFFRWWR